MSTVGIESDLCIAIVGVHLKNTNRAEAPFVSWKIFRTISANTSAISEKQRFWIWINIQWQVKTIDAGKRKFVFEKLALWDWEGQTIGTGHCLMAVWFDHSTCVLKVVCSNKTSSVSHKQREFVSSLCSLKESGGVITLWGETRVTLLNQV